MSFYYNLPHRQKIMFDLNFDCLLDSSKSYFIHNSNTGTGKTFQAVQLAKKIIKEHLSKIINEFDEDKWIYFCEFPELQTKYMKNYLGNLEELEKVKTIPFLILDDLGAGKDVNSNSDLASEIINARYNQMLPTIITSNFSVKELMTKYDQRMDRISEMCEIVKTPDTKYRTGDLSKPNNLENCNIFEKLAQINQENKKRQEEVEKYNKNLKMQIQVKVENENVEIKSNKEIKNDWKEKNKIMSENIKKGKLNHLQEKLETGQITRREFEEKTSNIDIVSENEKVLLKIAQKLTN